MAGARLSRGLAGAAWLGLAVLPLVSSPAQAHPRPSNPPTDKAAANAQCAGLRERIPGQYRERYERWKATLLSDEVGRRLWRDYGCNPAFQLTIVLSDGLGKSAEIKLDDYRWAEGRLTAATILLGHRLDRGYPDSTYYPVLGSLYYLTPDWNGGGTDGLLAAAKIVHELGHVDQTAKSDPARYRLQNELGQAYASHFRSNGFDIGDPALQELAARMGGMPTVLAGQREYWAETYALRYLLHKLRPGKRRELLRLVRKSLTAEPDFCHPSRTEWQTLTSFK